MLNKETLQVIAVYSTTGFMLMLYFIIAGWLLLDKVIIESVVFIIIFGLSGSFSMAKLWKQKTINRGERDEFI